MQERSHQQQTLVILDQTTPLADSRRIAHHLGIAHESFFALLKKYQKEVEEDFEVIRFEIGKPSQTASGGRPEHYALLTEDQTYTFLSYARNTRQARECKRLLVKAFASARQQLQAAPMPSLNTLWHKRALLFNEHTRLPPGYWCVFNEIAHVCHGLELRGIHLRPLAVPDISVGLKWMQEVRRLGLDQTLIQRYDHHYPDRRGIQQANIYPNAWLGFFRDWFERQYLPQDFQVYLQLHMQMVALLDGE